MQDRIAGKQVIDLTDILARFEAQEGEVQHIIGKTGMGKTYEGTRRALNYLYSGYTVYTTWKLNIPEYYDERQDLGKLLWKTITFKKDFFRFDLKNNWHYFDLDSYKDEDGIIDSEKVAIYLANITDAIVFLDEGQDVFDSNRKSGQITRQSITRTRHMHKTLIVVSQRAQAVDVNARANVTWFYKCVKRKFLFFPTRFRVYRTDEIDEHTNYPIWVRHDATGRITWQAPVWHSEWASQRIYDAYDSWYMRQNMIRSQDIKVDAYTLNTFDKFYNFFKTLFGNRRPKNKVKKDIPISPELSTPPAKLPVRVKVQ